MSKSKAPSEYASAGAATKGNAPLPQGRGKTEVPDFSIAELRACIPKHCFVRDHWRGARYVAQDVAMLAVLATAAWTFITPAVVPSALVRFALWMVYGFAAGSVATGLWVIAHECGHRAFSDSIAVNDAVGLVLHSLMLVPYHSWRITHGMHHKNTGHIDRDQVFVPATRSQIRKAKLMDSWEEAPLMSLFGCFVMVTAGWPAYLLVNIAGQDYGRRTNHFEPSSPVFKPQHRNLILLSDAALLVVIAGLVAFARATSFTTMMAFYGVPYLWVNFWLVSITYLQHTHQDIPHYADSHWNFVRGALTTIDRDVGIFNILHHHIADTHVAHHLFSSMPHYHAEEATEALKAKLGVHYRRSTENFFYAIYDQWRACSYIDDDGTVMYYHSFNGKSDKAKA